MWRAAALSAAKPPPHHRECDEIAPPHADHWLPPSRRGGAAGITSSRRRPRAVGCSTLNLSQKGRQVLGAVVRADEDQVGQKVIGDPEYGWRSLLVRLSGDLERTGTILPQRLKIVLYGTITAASGAAEDTPRGHLFATGARLELLGGSSDPLEQRIHSSTA